jgi:O-antigen ligase
MREMGGRFERVAWPLGRSGGRGPRTLSKPRATSSLEPIREGHADVEPEPAPSRREASLGERLAGPLLGFSLNGFFLYLGALDLLGIRPRTAITGVYYALLGAVIAGFVWLNRERLLRRVAGGGLPVWLFVGGGAALAVWFEANAALISHGSLSRRLAGELLLWTVPTALLVLALSRRQIVAALWTITALGLLLIAIDLVALVTHTHGQIGDRFSPIGELDPITTAQIPALGALAALALRPKTPGWSKARLVAIAALTAFAIIPGSRGPLAALVAGSLALFLLSWRFTGRRALVALLVGATVGSIVAVFVGSSRHLTVQFESGGNSHPISSLRVRGELMGKALRAIPSKPVFGHGVGALVDDTPEAHRMGIAGRHTFPHNTLIESVYSLGVLGFLLYVAMLAGAVWALVAWARRHRSMFATFAVAFFAYTFVNTNFSGELGADAGLWSACALGVALFASQVVRGGEAAPR